MSDPNGAARAGPEADDPETGSPYGTEPDTSTDNPGDVDVPELGTEDDLHSGSTGALPEG